MAMPTQRRIIRAARAWTQAAAVDDAIKLAQVATGLLPAVLLTHAAGSGQWRFRRPAPEVPPTCAAAFRAIEVQG